MANPHGNNRSPTAARVRHPEPSEQPQLDAVEIAAEIDQATYTRLLERHDIAIDQFVMAGNSMRSDIEPVVSLGGRGVHIPYHLTWDLEHTTISPHKSWVELSDIRQLPPWLAGQ